MSTTIAPATAPGPRRRRRSGTVSRSPRRSTSDAPPAPLAFGQYPPLIRALLRPEAYAHPAADIRLHETHSSWVILAGPYAYKIKKPVDFGFLDFSTFERREVVCRDEVALNRRLCPDLYLGVTYVVERDGRLSVGGQGRRLEPVVWMRRLPEDGLLTRLLARDVADVRLVRRIATTLAEFHASARTGPGVDEHGRLETVRHNWEESFEQVQPFLGQTLPPAVLEQVRTYANQFMRDSAELFAQRVAAGRIRDGHGDLHAASVCLDRRRLYLFDCLEFTPRFRCADVAADLAFLAMDLDHFGRADLANVLVETYERASRDRQIGALLTFYKCYRAFVRGKVLSLRLAEPGLSAAQRETLADDAEAYFDLAAAYAGGLVRPTLVAVMGLPASGKSVLARALAGRLGLVYLSSDVIRKELAGLRPSVRRWEPFGQGIYSAVATRRTYAALRRRAVRHLRQGQSVVIDATFGQVGERVALRRLVERAGARLVVLECQADEAILRDRLAQRVLGHGTISDARLDLWPALRAAYSEPIEFPERVTIATDSGPAAALAQALPVVLAPGSLAPVEAHPIG